MINHTISITDCTKCTSWEYSISHTVPSIDYKTHIGSEYSTSNTVSRSNFTTRIGIRHSRNYALLRINCALQVEGKGTSCPALGKPWIMDNIKLRKRGIRVSQNIFSSITIECFINYFTQNMAFSLCMEKPRRVHSCFMSHVLIPIYFFRP